MEKKNTKKGEKKHTTPKEFRNRSKKIQEIKLNKKPDLIKSGFF